MLTEEQILEIREHLSRAQNPVFFYDNDVDGLCSYVLLRKFLGRGKGVVVRTHPDIGEGYARKIQEFGADYVFVLDRPILGERFVKEVETLQVPIVWIDHHEIEGEVYDYKNLFIYNPMKSKSNKTKEPVTYWAYRIVNARENIWIAVMGCISDHYMPDFSVEFRERYKEFWGDVKEPFEAYFKTEIGFLARALSFGLKDSVTHVVKLQNFLIDSRNPNDLLLELQGKSPFAKKYDEIRKKYDIILDKAKKSDKDNIIFFDYGGNLSISSDISNELSFYFPKHFIIVAYKMEAFSNLSARGENVRDIIEKLLPGFENSSGGGHADAVGMRIQTKDLGRFKKEFEKEIGNRK